MTDRAVLVYDRIESNRRKSTLLLILLAVLSAPFFLYFVEYLMLWVAVLVPGIMRVAADDPVRGMAYAGAGALAVSLIVVMAVYRTSARLLLRLRGVRPLGPSEEPELWRTVENLCIGSGLPMPALYLMESRAANAFSTGMSPADASLVVTRGLLEVLERRELEGVIAHELSHIGNQDTRLSAALATAIGILWLPIRLVVGLFRLLFRIHWLLGAMAGFWVGAMGMGLVIILFSLAAEDPGASLWIVLIAGYVGYCFVGAPLAGVLVRMGASRVRELRADADAALLTGLPHRLASALEKMASSDADALSVTPAAAHLFTVDPHSRPWSWLQGMLSPHPPVSERVAALRAMGTPGNP